MLKDITLGQYIPANSPIHKLDPRTKIILSFVYMIALFMINNLTAYIGVLLFLGTVIALSKIPVNFLYKSIKPIMFFVLFTVVFNIFLTNGRVIFSWWIFTITYEGLYIAAVMALRLLFLIIGTSMLTYTTSPITLTDGIEHLMNPLKKIKVPSHEIAMMMTIALRFIPTIIDETDKIMKAQSSRGASFTSGSIMRRAKAMIPLLVPLLISAFRRAEELATAMECRCYTGGENRTKLKQLRYTTLDIYAYIVTFLFVMSILVLR